MAQQHQMAWKIRGMNKDISVSSFQKDMAWENMNLRLVTNENNTMFSWVNEKGPKEIVPIIETYSWDNNKKTTSIEASINGLPIGTAVIDGKLIVFTTEDDDRIYVFKKNGDNVTGRLLFKGELNFDDEHPIETFVSYERSDIEKVYWTDGKNQPRVINIASADEKLRLWNSRPEEVCTYFDFVTTVKNCGEMLIAKQTSGGSFSEGVIQYVYTYFNKYGQETNILNVSPLYYLAFEDRGAKADETVNNAFKITIRNLDSSFDYVRIYSIQRNKINGVPSVRRVVDLKIDANGGAVSYMDTGTAGEAVEPTEMFYKGGKEIVAQTIAEKDNTMFFGNIEERNTLMTDIQRHFDENKPLIEFKQDETKVITLDKTNGVYSHTNMLNKNQEEITTFKGGETYRFGIQLQKKTGEWLEPIYLGDKENTLYPKVDIKNGNWDTCKLSYASANIDFSGISDIENYKSVRPVVVFPSIADRSVICQGVINPTVFNVKSRKAGVPFAQASWFFRPYVWNGSKTGDDGQAEGSNEVDEKIAVEHTLGPVSELNKSLEETMRLMIKGEYVYVLYAELTDDEIKAMLNDRGRISVQSDYGDEKIKKGLYYFYYDYIVPDKSYTGEGKRYFLLRVKGKYSDDETKDAFPDTMPIVDVETGNSQGEEKYRYSMVYSFKAIARSEDAYAWNPSMRMEQNTLRPYYQKDDNNPSENETLFFRTTEKTYTINETEQRPILNKTSYDYWQITFDSLSDNVYDANSNSEGDIVEFEHYKSLYNGQSVANERRTEIEGSKRIYSSAYDTEDKNDASNTQFFVDQSIVTLNSPDIDFDADVQTIGKSGLKLRVIGMIPITGNASSHSIITSTNMLPLDYKEDGANVATEYGSGEIGEPLIHENVDVFAGRRLVADYLWNDSLVKTKNNKTSTNKNTTDYLVYPWQRAGSLNTDLRQGDAASSVLKTKKESTMLFSLNTVYFSEDAEFNNVSVDMPLTENAQVMMYKLKRQKVTSPEISYYPNIDQVLINTDGYTIRDKRQDAVNGDFSKLKTSSPVRMRYLSTSHAVVSMNANGDSEDSLVPIMPYGIAGNDTVGKWANPVDGANKVFWNKEKMLFSQKAINIDSYLKQKNSGYETYDYLWIGELYKDVDSRFGGDSEDAKLNNIWNIGGKAVSLENVSRPIEIKWTIGDTYYERYDCLKTYPMSNEDSNQIVEILSFMCESHVNIDGRCDKNRGQVDNTNMSPRNFNLMNDVYTQRDNFYSYQKSGNNSESQLTYPNQIYYSKTKNSGDDVDMYTNVTLASTLEMDGSKGEINAIRRFNNNLWCFQDKGIAQILYNENVQVSTQAGVPIEIANSGKVQGKRYLSETIGCKNKWSIQGTPNGLYFIDSNTGDIYSLRDGVANISASKGMNTWVKKAVERTSKEKWSPLSSGNFTTLYDQKNGDVLFVNKDTALAYSEKMGAFTSFYDYGGSQFLDDVNNDSVWTRYDGKETKLYLHNKGEYSVFFGENKPYWMTLVANEYPTQDKTFTNMSFTANVDHDVKSDREDKKPADFYLPFDSLEIWDEYQHGFSDLTKQRVSIIGMEDPSKALKRKFRLWHWLIPRDNAPISKETNVNGWDITYDNELGINRDKSRPMDRIRNTWAYIKLKKQAPKQRTEIHDLWTDYYV